MADYLFSYAYVVNGQWNFDHRIYELPRFTDKSLLAAQRDAARRHDKPDMGAHLLIVPIAVSKLDSPRMKIAKT